jgi:hypothetical protein
MNITRDNYEQYFLDYLDQNLEEHLVDDFIRFLRENPDLKDELEMMTTHSLMPENILFPGKSKLYKEKFDTESEFNRAAVARMEGDIEGKLKIEFEKYLSTHPEKQKHIALFEKTRLHPDNFVVFRKKDKLYQKSAVKSFITYVSALAAILLLSLLIFRYDNYFDSSDKSDESAIASTEVIPDKSDKSPVQDNGEADNKLIREPAAIHEQYLTGKNSPHSITTANIQKNVSETVITKREEVKINRISGRNPDRLFAEAAITKIDPVIPESTSENKVLPNLKEERLLADVVRENTNLDEISLNRMAKTGLTLMSRLSDKKFLFETNRDGEITEISFESRLLAFTIPTNRD